MTEIKNIKRIERVEAGSGDVYLRNAVVLAYFIDQPAHELGPQISAALDAYLELIPQNSLRWVIANSSSESWKSFTDRTIASCKKQLEPAGAKTRNMTSFELRSHEGDPPDYEFCFVGKPKGRVRRQAVSLLEMVFPIEVVGKKQVDQFFQSVVSLTNNLSFQSGYCSPALLYSDDSEADAYEEMRGLAMRHPGYDVENNMLSAWSMAGKIRGARWITLLGAAPLAALGGVKALQKELKEPISTMEIGAGLLIRAGQMPELGDVNRSVDTPLLRQVAKLLRPISFFGDRTLPFGQLEDDDTYLTCWEERFFS